MARCVRFGNMKRICVFSDDRIFRRHTNVQNVRSLTNIQCSTLVRHHLTPCFLKISTESGTPTNIVRLARALKPVGDDGVTQVTFYDAGIGTDGGKLSRITDGAVGRGIDRNIKELYTFLLLNYCKGDEIYLFGFSRGAYTVRSLAGLIREAGLLHRSHVHHVHDAYELYRSNVGADSSQACRFRKSYGSSVPIKVIACFDTVGALGIPKRLFGLDTMLLSRKYDFHNTTLSEDIENALHVLSIDETRADIKMKADTCTAYTPTLMLPHESRGRRQVTQRFFWGTHSGVGGGDPAYACAADITLLFIVDELRRRGVQLAFDQKKLPQSTDVTHLVDEAQTSVRKRITSLVSGSEPRVVPGRHWLHPSAVKRYRAQPLWRPQALEPLRYKLDP